MGRASWFASRICAALAGTILVGVAAALILTAFGILTCAPTCTSIAFSSNGAAACLAKESTCGSFAGALIFYLIWAPIFSMVLGTVPGIIALTLTPAKKHPWRSLPVLVFGTLGGFVIWMVLVLVLNLTHDSIGINYVALFLIPSIAGLVVAGNLERFPMRSRVR
jgi:hypothetical protein